MLMYMRDTLHASLQRNSSKRHMFRLTYPVHFGPHSMYNLRNDTQHANCSQTAARHWTASLAAGIIGRHVPLLDYYHVMRDR